MNFEKFERFLNSIDEDLQKIFEHQKEYLFCKKGCSLCCEKGDYPLSELEFKYLMHGFNSLDESTKQTIQKNIQITKKENKDSYTCPFLIDKKCSLYKYRPFVCRAFGVLTEDAQGNPCYPFCTAKGLNFSQIYDKEKNRLSIELVEKNNLKTFPKIFRLNNKVIMNLPLAKELNLDFGKSDELKKFL